ncbi:LuxR C-terminal-related transcriptional regulator [Arthrobacter psychrolactophilus]|nr:LuxR C-terminal-related transcriptional regulator [Arthrobacter psychrolactophilus]
MFSSESAVDQHRSELSPRLPERHTPTGRTFIGRLPHILELRRATQEAPWRGAVVLGQGGIGKTALIQEFLATVPAHTVTEYLRGTALTAGTPYGILGLLLGRSGLSAARQLSLAEVMTALSQRMRPAGSGGIPLVVVDNAECADTWSALALSELARTGKIRLILLCRRITGLTLEFSSLWRAGQLLRVELTAMTASETRSLLCQELEGVCSLSVANELWRRSRGNPLFLKALLNQAVSMGAVTMVDETWVWHEGRLGATTPLASGTIRRLMNAAHGNIEILECVAAAGVQSVAALTERFSCPEIDELLDFGDLDYAGSGKFAVVVSHPFIANAVPPISADQEHRDGTHQGESAIRLPENPATLSDVYLDAETIRHCSEIQAIAVAEHAEQLAMTGRQDDALGIAEMLSHRLGLTDMASVRASISAPLSVRLAAPLQRIYTASGEWKLLEELLAACQERGFDADAVDCVDFEVSSGIIQSYQGNYGAGLQELSQASAQLKQADRPGWQALASLGEYGATLAQQKSDEGVSHLTRRMTSEELTALEGMLASVLADRTIPTLLATLVQCLLLEQVPSHTRIPDTLWLSSNFAVDLSLPAPTSLQCMLFLAARLDEGGAERSEELIMVAGTQQGALAETLGIYAKGVLSRDSTVLVQVVERACRLNHFALSARAAEKALSFASPGCVRSIRRQLQRLVHLPADLSEPAHELSARLTEREESVGLLAAAGASNKEIAHDMGVSVRTVEGHLYQVYAKLQVTSRVELSPLLRQDAQ